MLRKLITCSPVWVFAVLAWAGSGAAEPPERVRHPRLHAALYELREARQELSSARDDFGGRRDKALAAIDDAVGSIKVILRVKDDNIRGVDRDADFYRRYRNHPHLRQALRDLRDAREELRDARADFGPLKERALRDVNRAIDEIEALLAHVRR